MGDVINIGPKERAKRRNVGIVMLAVAIGLAVWMITSGQPPLWRVIVAAPFGMGVLGLLQAFAGT
ncbi:MAG: hypothetical protein QNJ98_02070 [Planctomycetota bacterium]|nr:hypothetical protein [Planctomycetota bacterium]